MPAKTHTIGTLAAELLVKFPTLTDEASVTLVHTLLREICIYPHTDIDSIVPSAERTKILRFAKNHYPTSVSTTHREART